MKKILVTTPAINKLGKFKVSWFGKRGRYLLNANTVINFVERRYLVPTFSTKTAVRVKYGDGYYNETVNSQDPQYLLHALTCFLEEFLTQKSFKNLERKYWE